MAHWPAPPAFLRLSRRGLLTGLAALAGASVLAPGCGYPAEEGEAFAPWSFPGDETRPEWLAARAAILAANPHDTQPWLFAITPARIDLIADGSRWLGPMDPLRREMHLGLGCALENLLIAARHAGRAPTLRYGFGAGSPAQAVQIDLAPAPPAAEPFFEQIARRRTHRGPYAAVDPPAGLEGALRALLDDEAVRLTFLGDAARKQEFIAATVDATQAILDDTAMLEASHAWSRSSHEEIEIHRDGITVDAAGLDWATTRLGKSLAAQDARSEGNYWLNATRDHASTASAYVLLSTTDRDSREQQVRCGRIYQRLHLWATSVGLAMQPLNQLAERQDREQAEGLPQVFTPRLARLAGGPGAQMLFRIGVPWDEVPHSPRRPIEWVLAPEVGS